MYISIFQLLIQNISTKKKRKYCCNPVLYFLQKQHSGGQMWITIVKVNSRRSQGHVFVLNIKYPQLCLGFSTPNFVMWNAIVYTRKSILRILLWASVLLYNPFMTCCFTLQDRSDLKWIARGIYYFFMIISFSVRKSQLFIIKHSSNDWFQNVVYNQILLFAKDIWRKTLKLDLKFLI